MDDPIALGLVVMALTCRESNAVQWKANRAVKVRNDLAGEGITPDGILRDVRQYVRNHGQRVVHQVVESREDWKVLHAYYYKVNLPVPCYKYGLFIEMVLSDDDSEYPCVDLVNAHPQYR